MEKEKKKQTHNGSQKNIQVWFLRLSLQIFSRKTTKMLHTYGFISLLVLWMFTATTCSFILMLETGRMCGIIVKQPEFAHHQSSGYILTAAC